MNQKKILSLFSQSSPATFDYNYFEHQRIFWLFTMEKSNQFLFEVGGHGDLQTLKLMEDGQIVVKLGRANIPWFYQKDVQHKPNPEKWSAFLAELDELQVWDWKASYHRTDMCDGSQWELQLAIGDKKVKSYGAGLFPEKFEQFKEALNALLSK